MSAPPAPSDTAGHTINNGHAAPPTESKSIVIIGGSYAGISVAHYLLKHVLTHPALAQYTVTLVSASSSIFRRPAAPRAMISDDLLNQDQLFIDIPPLFKYAGHKFNFVHGKAMQVDIERRILQVEGKDGSTELHFGALVVSTGSTSSSPLLGLRGDFLAMKAEWDKLRKALPTAKKIVIAGGGPAGIEVAGELGQYLNGAPGWTTTAPKVEIEVISAGDRVLPDLPKKFARAAETYLAKMGVTCRPGIKVVKVTPETAGRVNVDEKCVVKLDHGEEVPADIYIPAIGFVPNTSFLPSRVLAANKKVQTDQSLRIEGTERMYSAGDVATYARPGIHLIFPVIPIVCHSIKQDLLRHEGVKLSGRDADDRTYEEDTRATQVIPLGSRRGVGSFAGWRIPSFMVWALKGRDEWEFLTKQLWTGVQWNKAS